MNIVRSYLISDLLPTMIHLMSSGHEIQDYFTVVIIAIVMENLLVVQWHLLWKGYESMQVEVFPHSSSKTIY